MHTEPEELLPGVWISGPVPRKYPEKNWSSTYQVQIDGDWVEDTIPESVSLIINTEQGLVIVTGCAHAGIVNIVEQARQLFPDTSVHAVIGGTHLLEADEDTVAWTANKLKDAGIEHFLGAHCTGIEAVYQIREHADLSRTTCSVAAIGATFTLGKGFYPGFIAR